MSFGWSVYRQPAQNDAAEEVCAHPNTDGKYAVIRRGKKNYFLVGVEARK